MKGPSILLLATLATLLAVEAAPISPFALEPLLPLQKRQHIPTAPLAPAPEPPTKAPPEATSAAPKPKPPTTPSPEIPPPETTPKPEPPPPQPQPTTPRPPSPPPPQQPQPKPSSPDTPHSPPSKPSHPSSHHTDASTPTGSASDAATTTGAAGGSPDSDGGVPTKVSDKVFIGLGTVGGLLVFALGGIAFCRHRRKKNLATALLEQTAQFNNNNPYAKMDEPDMVVKESMQMTPTKPIGTFSVVTTYTPALADEIEVGLGDSVTILQEFDDGWCLGVNNTRGRIRGVFPSHCVDMGQFGYGQDEQQYMPNPSFKQQASKRMSSMAPAQGWNGGGIGYYGQGGYDHYPPAPAYHGHHGHNGHNNGHNGHNNGYNQGYYDQGY
ncbi:hypothetical protein BG005_003597 [Podila minutissima]|nr:hypothetical protein BG005_003597 [Podila minutissima]